MNVSGITPEGRLVVSDAFKFVGTHGLPLDVLLHVLKQNDLVVDWIDFVDDARADGWKYRTIRARVIAAVADVYGPAYLKEFDKVFSLVIPA
jgi:alanyl-tRNA synthetase